MDGSLIKANASTDTVVSGPPELIAALRAAYREQEQKLDDHPVVGVVNQTHLNTTDPDAQLARNGSTPSRPSYKHHRAVDDAHGVITALTTTPGTIKEDTQLVQLIDQHQHHCAIKVQTVVADSAYGTIRNFLHRQDHGIRSHMADTKDAQQRGGQRSEFFRDDQFVYDPATDTYRCPAGQRLRRWQHRPDKVDGNTWWEPRYVPHVRCAANALRERVADVSKD